LDFTSFFPPLYGLLGANTQSAHVRFGNHSFDIGIATVELVGVRIRNESYVFPIETPCQKQKLEWSCAKKFVKGQKMLWHYNPFVDTLQDEPAR
jgi:hypothetical protein